MNPFSMMMAASRACNKKEDLVPSKPVKEEGWQTTSRKTF
jgi:hypothetical protein